MADFLQKITGDSGADNDFIDGDHGFGFHTANKLRANITTINASVKIGTGSPESAVSAAIGSLYFRTDGGDGTALYVKVSGSGNTGWKAIPTLSSSGTFTNKAGNISQWTNDSAYLTATTNVIHAVTTTLNNAQIKALPTTSIALTPIPPSGYWHKPLGISYTLNNALGAYTGIDSPYSDIGITTGAAGGFFYVNGYLADDSGYSMTQVTDFLGTTHASPVILDAYNPGTPVDGGDDIGAGEYVKFTEMDSSKLDNQALVLTTANVADFGGGHASNSLKVTVYYAVEAI